MLGGEGGRGNWVPLKATTNVDKMWCLVEKELYDFFQDRSGRAAEVEITPHYDMQIPVPSRIAYVITFHYLNESKVTKSLDISNDLDLDHIPSSLIAMW
jgi:hypothetical protein